MPIPNYTLNFSKQVDDYDYDYDYLRDSEAFWENVLRTYSSPPNGNICECRLTIKIGSRLVKSPWFGLDSNLYLIYYKNYDANHEINEQKVNILEENRKPFQYRNKNISLGMEQLKTYIKTVSNFRRDGQDEYIINDSMNLEIKAITHIIFLICEAARFGVIRNAIDKIVLSNTTLCDRQCYVFDTLVHNWGILRNPRTGYVSIGAMRDSNLFYPPEINFLYGNDLLKCGRQFR